ncbi:MAG: hypothetical protein V4467_02925 [Patescibacteria group bacterium]
MKSFKNTTLSILIVSLIAGPTLFSFPTQAKAGVTDCIAGMLLSKTKSTGTTVAATAVGTGAMTSASGVATANKITSVPTSDAGVAAMIQGQTTAITSLVKADATINSGTNSQTTGLSIKRCIIEPIVTIMARTLLTKFTAQTVNWINGGFQGSPQYVTNIQGFMSDVADQAIGSYIRGLGPIGAILCGPFDLQVRLSLNLQYSKGPNLREIGCRLSDIQKNVQNAFTKGVFGKNGWDNWLQITQTPQNNPYGAYLKGVESIDAKIAGQQFALKTQLDFGRGFLSSVDPATGKITTPGSIIEGQLNATLIQPLQNIGLAKDIDAILNALVGQMISQVMGGIGGLAGASDSRSASGGYSSAVDLGLKQTPATVSNANNQAQSLQVGLYMNTIGGGRTAATTACPTKTSDCPTVTGGPTPTEFCTQFKANVYGTKPNDARVWVKVNGTGGDQLTSKTSATGDVPWTLADYRATANFCQFVDITTPIGGEVDKFVDQITPKGEVTAPVITPAKPPANNNANREISLYTAKLNQSFVYRSDEGILYGPQNVFGQIGALTYGGPAPHWWTASLNQTEKIETITVKSIVDGRTTGAHTIRFSLLPDSQSGVAVSLNQVNAGQNVFEFTIPSNPSFGSYSIRIGGVEVATLSGTNNDFTITFKNPISANALAISRPTFLWLSQVTLSRPQSATVSFDNAISDMVLLSKSQPTNISVGFSSRLDKTITIKTSLQKYFNGSYVGEAFAGGSVFESFSADIQQPASGLAKGPFNASAMESGQSVNITADNGAFINYSIKPPTLSACDDSSLPQYRLITTISADETWTQVTPLNIKCSE